MALQPHTDDRAPMYQMLLSETTMVCVTSSGRWESGANRYLCDDCLEVYTALNLVVGPAKDTPSFSKSARSLPLRIRAEVVA